MDPRAFAAPKGLRPRRRVKPADDAASSSVALPRFPIQLSNSHANSGCAFAFSGPAWARVARKSSPRKRGAGARRAAQWWWCLAIRGEANRASPHRRAHRGDFGFWGGSSGHRREPQLAIPTVSRRSPVPRPAGTQRQSLVVGPDRDPKPPGRCLRGTRAGRRLSNPTQPACAGFAEPLTRLVAQPGDLSRLLNASRSAPHGQD
jgi:hypothetical protein